jgi:rhamnopyranosyl-N-acetylglucosaminyl-diphospho-decaprenol beta-1,3/1,4-galactofuranosyltransferase
LVASEVVATVLSYQAAESLEDVLRALDSQTIRPGRIVVVDNASTDNTPEVLARFAGVHRVMLGENIGVGAGHATAWAEAVATPGCSWVWVLEHDTVPASMCLEHLMAEASRLTDSGVAVAGLMPRTARNEEEAAADPVYEADFEANRITFNGLLLHRDTIETAGFPRPDFFVGLEDTEYFERLRRAHLIVYGAPTALVFHRTKGNKRHNVERSVVRNYYSTRNSLYYQRIVLRQHHAIYRYVAAAIAATVRSLAVENMKLRRVAARWTATIDGALGRLGRRSYWFLDVRG